MTFLHSEDVNVRTASNDGFDVPPCIARAGALCSIARSRRAVAKISPTGARRVHAGASMSLSEPSAATGSSSDSRNRLVLVVYTAAIFVSALLLFSVQPLFTKMVLPRLGGSPAVWSVAMVFFQSLLLGGYAYAHFLMQLRNRAIPVIVHLVLLVIALLTLPAAAAGLYTSHLKSMMILTAVFNAVFIGGGLLLSCFLEVPSGPAVVVLAGLVYIISMIWKKHHK
jgi:hypothetical protein